MLVRLAAIKQVSARCRRVKMTRLRARVAERLKGAQNTYAMLTTFNEIDMTNLMQLRADFKVSSNSAHCWDALHNSWTCPIVAPLWLRSNAESASAVVARTCSLKHTA